PTCANVLSPNGLLVVLGREWDGRVLRERLQPLFRRHSPVRDYQPYDVIDELEQRKLFSPLGHERFGPEPWRPTMDEYLECRHSQRGFSRTHMGAEAAAAFDADLRATLEQLCVEGVLNSREGRLELQVWAHVTWGKPRRQ